MNANKPLPPLESMLPDPELDLDDIPNIVLEPLAAPPDLVSAEEVAADLAIPTLDSVAHLDAEKDAPSKEPDPEPVLIGGNPENFSKAVAPLSGQLSAEDIQRITESLRTSLIPEIEKAVTFAMNHAFAYAMDQASHILKQKVHAKLNEALPKLVNDAIKRPPAKE